MSAIDSFEWFVTTQVRPDSPGVGDFVARQREYLYTIRSEDERQRFVEWVIREIRRIVQSREKPRGKGRGTGPVGN